MNEFTHAQKVVEQFKTLLSREEIQGLEEEHMDELILLIEAAIDAAVLEALEKTADKLEQLAMETRRLAEKGA
ncbi:MAG: hypothetical protein AXA67_04175 [Methylothermaceae bacteria B42]|nr:MAG: hypothetical protein AXA67_04175 [Methylothermaceae bacteria B42]HHJ38641.1 phosphatase [Methylothermaceae bacterium]